MTCPKQYRSSTALGTNVVGFWSTLNPLKRLLLKLVAFLPADRPPMKSGFVQPPVNNIVETGFESWLLSFAIILAAVRL